jgi:aminoglycoside 6'-N-acetyltransferase
MDEITFQPLKTSDFSKLCQWLNAPHVHKFWGEGLTWTEEKVKEKYLYHPEGFQVVGSEKKPVHAFLIYLGHKPIGYIQYYDVFDFPRKDVSIKEILSENSYLLPKLAGLDLYIGENEAMGKGIGPLAIRRFLEEFVWKEFSACLVDPDKNNRPAIRAYEKAGFKPLKALEKELLMIAIKKETL